MFSHALRCSLITLTLVLGTQAATVRTDDELTLELSDSGRVTHLQIGETILPLTAPGGFALADFRHQPASPNLVPNPGFEDGATGWELARGQVLDTQVVHSGKAAVRLDVPGPTPAQSNLGVVVPVRPNTRYRVGLWLRRDKVGVCGAYTSERNDQGKLTGLQTQTGPYIPASDGVWLPLRWEVTTQAETTRLSLRADIYRSSGTLWVDDFFIEEMNEGIYTAVDGRLSMEKRKIVFRGGLPDLGLEVEATFGEGAEGLSVDGLVRDTTGQDRAVGVRFALPLDLTGWTWFNDAEERETIGPQTTARRTYDCVSALGRCSVYPWSALTGPTAGLSLALPLSQGPRVFVIQHDQRQPETSVTFYIGLAKDAGNHPSRAPFSFVIYRHAPAWGMRSAMERYYRFFPESFAKRPQYEGYLNYANLEAVDPALHQLVLWQSSRLDDASDFGEGYRFIWHLHGCYDFRQIASTDPQRPTDVAVFGWLGQMAEAEKAKPGSYTPSTETVKKIAFGSKGDIGYIGDTRYWRPHEGYNHTDQAGWGLNFRVNEDPDISPFLADLARRQAEDFLRKNPKRQPWDATFTADAIEGYMANSHALNFRREHFRTTAVPLTFGRDSLQPAMPNTIWDFHQKAWHPLTEASKIVTYGNANGYEQFFTMPFVDIPMTEDNWDPQHDGRLDRFMRAVGYRKIWRYWHAWGPAGGYADADPDSVRRQLRRGLAYSIYPPVACIAAANGDIEQHRAWFRQYVPAIEELSMAGWEPVAGARAGNGLIVERFGSFGNGELHFTVRNYADAPVDAILTLDRQALAIPAAADLLSLDILPRSPQPKPFPREGLPLHLDADGTLALWIGSRDQAVQHGFRLGLATLEKLERLFSSEMDETARAAWGQATAAARQGATTANPDALSLAEALHRAADQLERELKTKAAVDLHKLIFRLRADVSLVPVAALGLRVDSPRLLLDCPRGESTRARLHVAASGSEVILNATIQAPWQEIADRSAIAVEGTAVDASLFVPVEPPRRLLPYLAVLNGVCGKDRITVALPIDLQTGAPLEVGVQTQRAFRGQTRHLVVTLANRLNAAAPLTLTFAVAPKARVVPPVVTVALPPRGVAETGVDLQLEPSAAIGALCIPYSVTSADRRFTTQGALSLTVSDPVPQLDIRRVAAPPVLDGDLADAAWQTPPAIPELRLLAGGGQATEKTAVWAAYDDTGLYVAIRCRETQMDKLVATLAERGAPLYKDDDVELFIQIPGGKQVLQFAVNPLGTRSDNFGNQADWRAAARRGVGEWSVELSIPYAAARVARTPAPGSTWAMQFGRQQKAKGETTAWTPGQAFVSKENFGEIVFR